MKRFGLIGASGYIAPRHVEAIKNTGNDLVALLDPYDGIGFIDKYYPGASYFKETERFDRHLDRLKRKGMPIDYVSICSPNYLHDAHIRLSLRNGCNVICEKPLVLNSEHLESLQTIESESSKKINTILQLRHHPTIIALKEKYGNCNRCKTVKLDYITPRGVWYDYSWKGDIDKSGGLPSNIGVHFFDMLIWIFGKPVFWNIYENTSRRCRGRINLERASVNFNLSIDKEDLPWDEWKPYRSIKIDDEEVEFSTGFTDLHTVSYEHILNGQGFTINDVADTIRLMEVVRNS